MIFGNMPCGKEVEKITLTNAIMSADVITYGGTLTSLRVPDKTGNLTNVVLGLDSLEEYQAQDKFLGALVGRYANRIGNAKFSLNGQEYELEKNDGANHLHGGSNGFYSRVWKILSQTDDSVSLGLESPDMDGGYPGKLSVKVTYSLVGSALHIDYEAESDADTLCNLTNHAYYNLSGDFKSAVLDHEIKIYADKYTPTDSGSIPTGELADVANTPLDLREFTKIGDHIDDDFEQMKFASGYDHNFAINGACGTLRPAAEVYCEKTGILMKFKTDQCGMQFYSGNYLEPLFGKRTAFCLESQAFPDSPNKPNFPSSELKKGERYKHKAVIEFSVK
ncbi:MAG: aldose epimerase family protein [Bacillota bacterium]|nr:aldose epimerase family protein [Bacillota bacterium]